MSVERIIGIDFGTSTSVMRVKRYQENGQPVDDRLYTAEVKFANNSLVPTLIRKMEAGEPYYGYDAQPGHRKKKSTLFDNFKVELESPDLQAREQARALTAEFFAYLAKRYKEQESRGFFGEADETEKTLISYPVKWSEETRSFMLEAARKAGFKNVEGMDEAQAAITAVMVQSADYLSKRGYLQDGMPANILMVDMGAGTTDLVLCRYTPGRNAKYEILSVWPRDGSTLFGGCEVEVILQGYLRSMLPEEDADIVMKRCSLSKFKSWKEDYVSRALSRNETVMEFTDFDDKVQDLEIDIEEYVIDRGEFEKMAADYLKGFPTLINGCLRDAGFSGDEVDLVLLTGGHSQWYFVKELLCGRLSQFGTVGLGKIQADPERIIPDPRPQETVALGLVYSPLAKEVRFAGKINMKQEEIDHLISEFYNGVCEQINLDGFHISVKVGLLFTKDSMFPLVHECVAELRERIWKYIKNWTGVEVKVPEPYESIVLDVLKEEMAPGNILSYYDEEKISGKCAIGMMAINVAFLPMEPKRKETVENFVKIEVVSAAKKNMDNRRAYVTGRLSQKIAEILK